MRAPERLAGWRVVAEPAALDALGALAGAVVRLAPDDAFVLGGDEPAVDDPDAIVVPEHGYVGWPLAAGDLAAVARRSIDWSVPTDGPAVAQGLVAQVPAKLWIRADGSAVLFCAAAYGAELQERLA